MQILIIIVVQLHPSQESNEQRKKHLCKYLIKEIVILAP